MPLVGDAGRSVRSGEMRPCVGDIASARAPAAAPSSSTAGDCASGGANFCDSSVGKGDRTFRIGSVLPLEATVPAEMRRLPRPESARGGGLEVELSSGGLESSGSNVDSRDMPGSCRFPKEDPDRVFPSKSAELSS